MPHKDADAANAFARAWRAKRRAEWVASRGGACEQCGSTTDLEVDHIDPATKLYNPGQVWTARAEIREAELAKCQVLCKSCHLEKSWGHQMHVHGTRAMYTKHKCRCEECRAWRAADHKRRKATKH